MNGWIWTAAPGGTGFTLTSNNGNVLVYVPNEGLNVRMQPVSQIGDPGAAWLPVFTGQNVYFAIVSAVDQSLALTVFDGGPPWTSGQMIDAEPFDPDNVPPSQAWAFAALGETEGCAGA